MAVSVFRAHAAHFVVFGVPALALVLSIGWQEVRARVRTRQPVGVERRPPRRSPATWTASAGLAVAGAVHLSIIREHFHEYVLSGAFFALLAIAQLAIAAWVAMQPERAPLRAIAMTSACVVGLWLASRTTGLPVGPEPWKPESWGALDAIAGAAELLTVAGCVVALHRPAPVARTRRAEPAMVR
jgi:hypothetical protein